MFDTPGSGKPPFTLIFQPRTCEIVVLAANVIPWNELRGAKEGIGARFPESRIQREFRINNAHDGAFSA
jgi:hypothetical protein